MNAISYQELKTIDELDILLGKESNYMNFCYRYKVDTINLLKNNSQLEDNLYLFALLDTAFAGFVSCDSDWWEPNSFFLRELFVSPEHQGKHIGSTLIQKCIDHAKAHNSETLVTQTAHENIPRQKICESFGFKSWKNPRWHEGVTYKLSL